MKLFIAPHNDDETLFGAFTILRERPLVLIVTDSARQAGKGITAGGRRAETQAAMRTLGAEVHFLGIPDIAVERDCTVQAGEVKAALARYFSVLQNQREPLEHIFAPAKEQDGNIDHNAIAELQFECPTTRYLTYTAHGKSRSANCVPFEKDWPLLKLQALTCYRSQIFEPSTRDHFLRDQYEYYA